VLALRSRGFDTSFERAALAVPAVTVLVTVCAAAQQGVRPMPVAALGVLLAVAIGAALTGLSRSNSGTPHRMATLLSYLEYVAVGSLIPLALWVVGVYQRLGI
jgi:hypothetical protein